MNLAQALCNCLTENEARAIWYAISQYIENAQCNNESEDPYEDQNLSPLECVARRMDMEMSLLGGSVVL